MSARQPFFPSRPGSESQGTNQGFNQKTFLIDSSNPLHLASQATIPTTDQSESTKIAFNVPGPFSSNGTNGATQVKTSGIGGLSKKKSAHSLSQSVEKSSLNSLGFLDLSNVRPGTADPYSGVHQDRATALKSQRHQKASCHSLGLLDAGSIVRPGTAVPQSRALQDYPTGLQDIRAPIPKPAVPTSSAFLSHNAFSDQAPENGTHISTTETKNGASRQVDDVGDLTFHSSSIGGAFNKIGPQRVPIEQQFGQYNTEVDQKYLKASMTSHEVTADGRLKMSALGQTKKRNRDEVEEDGDGNYWVESQTKRHKSHRREEFETRSYAMSPPFSPRLEKATSRDSHTGGDVRQHLPDTRDTPRSARYRERRTTPDRPPYESLQAEQASPEDTGNAFEKLLGRNTDIFVKQNMEKYNRMVKKWSECPEEEWIAGAEVIAEKYVKLVSYVKDAMIAKINAYANIQVDIGRHFSDLGERDQLLDAARKKLVMESVNALG